MAASEPTDAFPNLLSTLRDLARTERLEGYERDALRRAAAELERLQPGNLRTRSEYRAVMDEVYPYPLVSFPQASRKAAHVAAMGETHHLEHRTVVESEWRPVR